MLILDPDHTIIAANEASQKVTGRHNHEIVGHKCYENEIFHGDQAQGCMYFKCYFLLTLHVSQVSNHRQSRWLNGLRTAQSGIVNRSTDHHSVVAYLKRFSCSIRWSSFS
jgi:PAS domain-containing protein